MAIVDLSWQAQGTDRQQIGISDSTMTDKNLDTQGLACPLPILKTKKAMREMGPGATLEVLATDPGSQQDFEAFCKATGHTLLSSEVNDGVYRFVIEHKS